MADLPSPSDPPEQQFLAAKSLLEELLEVPRLAAVLDPDDRPNTKMVYTHAVTMWLLILQRLRGGASLSEVVSEAVLHPSKLFPDNKRVREATLAENTSTYSKARKRLPTGAIHGFSRRVCDYLARQAEPIFEGRRVFILDGTTITLPPTPALKNAYPPATNQHGESVWPVAMLMLAAELQTGCVLAPKIAPMYGPENSSEAALARKIVRELPENSVVLADAGFGIYSVAHFSRAAGHDFLFRLSSTRFKSHQKKAQLIDEGENHKSYELQWTASDKERATTPDLPADTHIDAFLHEVQLENGTKLFLISSLPLHASCLTQLYSRRYDIEFDIRDFKVTLDTENLRAKSVAMIKKELFASVIGYNLVMQFRRGAAKLARVSPRALSFTGVWLSFRVHLLSRHCETYEQWQKAFTAGLASAAKRKLPVRKEPRSHPRVAHPRRAKSTKYKKSTKKTEPPVLPEE